MIFGVLPVNVMAEETEPAVSDNAVYVTISDKGSIAGDKEQQYVVKAGDLLDIAIYKNTGADAESYAYFNQSKVSAKTGEKIELTLKKQADVESNVAEPVSGAVIYTNGTQTPLTTDSEGKVILTFAKAGTYTVYASTSETTVAGCVITVTGEDDTSASVTALSYYRLNGTEKIHANLSPAFSSYDYYISNEATTVTIKPSGIPFGSSYKANADIEVTINGQTAANNGGKYEAVTLNLSELTFTDGIATIEMGLSCPGDQYVDNKQTIHLIREHKEDTPVFILQPAGAEYAAGQDPSFTVPEG